MAYLLDSTTIRNPHELDEGNRTQMAQHQTLDGTVRRDYFGDNKRVWQLSYRNTKKADYDEINTIYQAYLANTVPVSWEVTETNYTVSETEVHIDLIERGFSVRGTDYLSDFDLILVEV